MNHFYSASRLRGGSVSSPPAPVQNEENFTGSGPLTGVTTFNALDNDTVLDVRRLNDRYYGELKSNASEITTFFNALQGEANGWAHTWPFEIIAHNIGIGQTANTQLAPTQTASFIFCGLQVHVETFNSVNSAHMVVGYRNDFYNTVEGKNTVDSVSTVTDEGQGALTNPRADIRIVGSAEKVTTWYYRNPGDVTWTLYGGTGSTPGSEPTWSDTVYINILTYASGTANLPFAGTCDRVEFVSGKV